MLLGHFPQQAFFRWPEEKWKVLMSTLFRGFPTEKGRNPGARTAAAVEPTSSLSYTWRACQSHVSSDCASAVLRGGGKKSEYGVSSSPSISRASEKTSKPGLDVTPPASAGEKPALDVTTPASAGVKPALDVTTPASAGVKPAFHVTTPASVGGKPALDATTPASVGGKPALDVTTPGREWATEPPEIAGTAVSPS